MTAGRYGRPPDPRGPCAICGATKVIRFRLVVPKGQSSRSAGAIDLCQPCWGARTIRPDPKLSAQGRKAAFTRTMNAAETARLLSGLRVNPPEGL